MTDRLVFTEGSILHWSTVKLIFLSQYRFLTNFDMGNTKMTFFFAHSISFFQKFSPSNAPSLKFSKIAENSQNPSEIPSKAVRMVALGMND